MIIIYNNLAIIITTTKEAVFYYYCNLLLIIITTDAITINYDGNVEIMTMKSYGGVYYYKLNVNFFNNSISSDTTPLLQNDTQLSLRVQ